MNIYNNYDNLYNNYYILVYTDITESNGAVFKDNKGHV